MRTRLRMMGTSNKSLLRVSLIGVAGRGLSTTTCLSKLKIVFAMFCLISSCAIPGVARAQATGGSITGTVVRDAGGIMPGVRVSLADQSKTVAREATTDMNGF